MILHHPSLLLLLLVPRVWDSYPYGPVRQVVGALININQ